MKKIIKLFKTYFVRPWVDVRRKILGIKFTIKF